LAYRWADIMQDIAKHGPEYLEEDDLMLLNKKVKEVRRKELNAKILDEIASQQRLNTAQERFSKSGKIDTTPYLTGSAISNSAISKPQGQQKVWWSGNVPDRWSGNTPDPAYDINKEAYFGRSVLDMIERGGDIATVQNIRATNKMLEEELETVKKDIAK